MAAHARINGERHEVYLRFAEIDDRIYIDLGDLEWRCVEIDSGGWRIIKDPPVRFWRSANMRPLPVPEKGGSIKQLQRHVILNDAQFTLFVGVLLSALRRGRPHAIPYFFGEPGSAKSWRTEVIRALTDPNKAPVRSLPKTEENLWVAAHNAPVLAFNNISRISKEISDALCQTASGEGFSRRARYTDSAEFVVEGSRMVILNGIKNAATEPDLADRVIVFALLRLRAFQRMEKVRKEFYAERAVIFGSLLDAMVHGLRELPGISEVRPSSRVSDFVDWGVACEGAFTEPGTFLAAYDASAAEATETAIAARPVAVAVLAFMVERISWRGTITELYNELGKCDPTEQQVTRETGWPRSVEHFGREIRAAATILRKAGVELVTPDEDKHLRAPDRKRTRLIELHRIET